MLIRTVVHVPCHDPPCEPSGGWLGGGGGRLASTTQGGIDAPALLTPHWFALKSSTALLILVMATSPLTDIITSIYVPFSPRARRQARVDII